MGLYLVEMTQYNRVISVRSDTNDYDTANTVFTHLKKEPCRELKFSKVVKGVKVLLKHVTKIKHQSTVITRRGIEP